MTITDVRTQRDNPQRRSIFVDGEFALGVSQEVYLRYELYRGRDVSQAFLDEVRISDESYRCKLKAMELLGYRLRSRKELAKRLVPAGFSDVAIEATMVFLEEYNMIDDIRFAHAYVNTRLIRRALGRTRLEQELRQKGIGREDAADVVNDVIDDESEFANALSAARSKLRLIRHNDPRKVERSLSAFLAGRGFGWTIVDRVLRQLREEQPG